MLCQGLGAWASFAHQVTSLPTPEVDSFVKAAIFATLTNVSEEMTRIALAMFPMLLIAGGCLAQQLWFLLRSLHLSLARVLIRHST